MSTVLTVADVLNNTNIGNGLHQWRVEGGVILVAHAKLRQALKEAYDANMPDWPAMVEVADA